MSGINEIDIARTTKQLSSFLADFGDSIYIHIPGYRPPMAPTAADLVKSHLAELDFTAAGAAKATQIACDVIRQCDEMLWTPTPPPVAGAMLCLIADRVGEPRTAKQVAEILACGEDNLKRIHTDLRARLGNGYLPGSGQGPSEGSSSMGFRPNRRLSAGYLVDTLDRLYLGSDFLSEP